MPLSSCTGLVYRCLKYGIPSRILKLRPRSGQLQLYACQMPTSTSAPDPQTHLRNDDFTFRLFCLSRSVKTSLPSISCKLVFEWCTQTRLCPKLSRWLSTKSPQIAEGWLLSQSSIFVENIIHVQNRRYVGFSLVTAEANYIDSRQ